MRRGAIGILLLAGALMLVVCPCLADEVSITVHDGYNREDASVGGGMGGEFWVETASTGWYIEPGAAVKSHYPPTISFATFCVETTEYIYPPNTYKVQTDQNTPVANGAVAYLFDQWYSGSLAGYRYDDVSGGTGDGAGGYVEPANGRATDAYWLQRLIWHFQGVKVYNPSIFTDKYAGWYSAALANQNIPTGGVKIMHLTKDSNPAQDLLILVPNGHIQPIPEPGSIALLATGALGLLPVLRRRRTV